MHDLTHVMGSLRHVVDKLDKFEAMMMGMQESIRLINERIEELYCDSDDEDEETDEEEEEEGEDGSYESSFIDDGTEESDNPVTSSDDETGSDIECD